MQLPKARQNPAALASARTGAEVEPLERRCLRQRCPLTPWRQRTRRAVRRRLAPALRRTSVPACAAIPRPACTSLAGRLRWGRRRTPASRPAPSSRLAEQLRGAHSRRGAISAARAAVDASEHQGHTLHVAPDRDRYTAIKRAPLDPEGRLKFLRAAVAGRHGCAEGRAGARRAALARGAAAGPWTGSATATRPMQTTSS